MTFIQIFNKYREREIVDTSIREGQQFGELFVLSLKSRESSSVVINRIFEQDSPWQLVHVCKNNITRLSYIHMWHYKLFCNLFISGA